MIVNFAERAHNHNWELDPVIRSLLDTDFYKLLMLQFIWKHYPKTRVSFALFNRTSSVRLADMFATREIAEQLEHVRKLRFRKSELVWLAGNTFYGRRGIFEPAFLEWLEQDFKLSDYALSVNDGQFHLSFEGDWPETTMWELYALSVLDELRTRANMKKLSEFYLDILYARAKTKLWNKIERLRGVPSLNVADFGTRRGVRELSEIFQVLGRIFDGTSRRADPGGEVAAEFLRCVHDVVEVTVEPIPAVTTAQAGFDYDLLLVWVEPGQRFGQLRPDRRHLNQRGCEQSDEKDVHEQITERHRSAQN